jgi:hypothetical protein
VCAHRIVFVAVVVPMLATLIPPAARGQQHVTRERAGQRIPLRLPADRTLWVVPRGQESVRERESAAPDAAPPRLTLSEKSALLTELAQIDTALGSWSVTPSAPIVRDRLWLVMHRVEVFNGDYSFARLFGGDSAKVSLYFVPPAAARYLVDCRVEKKLGSPVTYHVSVGTAEQTFTNTDHLLFVTPILESSSARRFAISAPDLGNARWNFYGCEVTPLK